MGPNERALMRRGFYTITATDPVRREAICGELVALGETCDAMKKAGSGNLAQLQRDYWHKVRQAKAG